jgi:hypothetical protein
MTSTDRPGGPVTDPVASNPALYSVAFENDRVRVLRYHDHPGDRTRPHGHPDSVMITASTFERRLRHDGQSVDVTIPAGEVRWLDAQEHSGENIGSTDTVTFFVELKEEGAPREPGAGILGPRS